LHSNNLTNGAAEVPQTAILQMEIRGGIPDYTISVKLDGEEIFDPVRREARISPGMPGTLHPITPATQHATLVISISDSAKEPNTFSETIRLLIREAPREQPADRRDGSLADRPPDQAICRSRSSIRIAANSRRSSGLGISHNPAEHRGVAETL
jgi:hypothetical protein